MKKILVLLFILLNLDCFALAETTTFTNEIFQKAQSEGKTVVINSWNKTCVTCAKQVQILDQAKKDFENVLFLSFEQTKDIDIAKFLSVDYWTTILVYKDNKEISRTIGQTDKEKIYSQIKAL
jgi:thiol-disulfide isomerase/thioredoxin|tara:strand:- start:1245 stop:1613 length:369 start_codon:yes stop_codon:yes gene_type:complete